MVSKFTGQGDRARLAALGDVEAREHAAVATAQERRAASSATAESDATVWVSEGDLEAVVDQGSIVVFTGTDAQGRLVTFGVDHRPARDLVEAVRAHEAEDEGPLPCYVESWQVLRRTGPVV